MVREYVAGERRGSVHKRRCITRQRMVMFYFITKYLYENII